MRFSNLAKYTLVFLLGLVAGAGIEFWLVRLVDSGQLSAEAIQVTDVVMRGAALVATVAAIFVALFKDDLRRPDVVLKPPADGWIQEGDLQTASVNIPGTTEFEHVEEYSCCAEAHNSSGIVARDCELILEQLVFKDPKGGIKVMAKRVTVAVSTSSLNPRSLVVVNLFRLQLGTTQEENTKRPPVLQFGEVSIPDPGPGSWRATYRMSGSNFDPRSIVLDIEWDGKWHPRRSALNLNVTESK